MDKELYFGVDVSKKTLDLAYYDGETIERRNSMFFGSHEGAGRAAILYSIAISCRLNGINLFEYICDVIEKTAEWQPNTPWEKYRDLLPDRWKKQ